MSIYTTGEVAKQCGVSVRTVQYYDTRGILTPSQLSEGGRRLYSEDDLRQMKVICFLRELGLPISSIGQLLSEADPGSVIFLLLQQQEQLLQEEISQQQAQLARIAELAKGLKHVENFSVESINDIAHIMENKKKIRKLRALIITIGIIMDIIEIGTIILWVTKGIWWPFAVGMCIVVALGIWISSVYFKKTAYICPQCHKVFKPRFREAFWAVHTPRTRRLTCPDCGHKGFCVETYGE